MKWLKNIIGLIFKKNNNNKLLIENNEKKYNNFKNDIKVNVRKKVEIEVCNGNGLGIKKSVDF